MDVHTHTASNRNTRSSQVPFSSLVLNFEADTIRRLPLREVNLSEPTEGIRWLHFAGNVARSREWLQNSSPLDSTHIEALCSELARPRLFVDSERHLMLTLRTARATSVPSLDFMSLRVWASGNQLISVSLSTSEIVSDFVTHLHLQRRSVVATEQLLLELSQYITLEFTQAVDGLGEEINSLEARWKEKRSVDIATLVVARQKVARIGRHLSPQLEAVQKAEEVIGQLDLPKAMKKRYHDGWREVSNRVRRDIEALAEMRERVTILSDTLHQVSNERITRTMYLLSVVVTLFLPLTFVAGLLGMNAAGIPASDAPLAFWVVCGLMAVIVISQWYVFHRWHRLR